MARGGFDVVLGNPPWETMSPDNKEFFSSYDPSVRAMSPADQKSAFASLLENPAISANWGRILPRPLCCCALHEVPAAAIVCLPRATSGKAILTSTGCSLKRRWRQRDRKAWLHSSYRKGSITVLTPRRSERNCSAGSAWKRLVDLKTQQKFGSRTSIAEPSSASM